MKTDFQPVIIGSDNTVYGLARSFHMAYGKKSIVICRHATNAILGSKIISEICTEPKLMDENIFVKKLTEIADTWYKKNPNTRLLLVTPVSDVYAELVSKNRLKLENLFDMNVPDWKLYQKLTNKTQFYKLCEKYGLDYPKYTAVDEKSYKNPIKINFPAVIKPADSASYWQLPRFDGYQKVYFVDNQTEAIKILDLIFGKGYSGEVIIQEKIPADTAHQQDITTYSGKKSAKVNFTQLFQAVLADNNPLSTGIFCALLPAKNASLENKIAKFLNDIGYTGFAGLNIMIDPRDNKPKLLELNARLHGESYALTAMGNNPAKILISDIYGGDFKKTDTEIIWKSVPNHIIRKFMSKNSIKDKVIKLLKQGKTDTELNYKVDLSPKRRKNYYYFMLGNCRNFKKFARQSEIN